MDSSSSRMGLVLARLAFVAAFVIVKLIVIAALHH